MADSQSLGEILVSIIADTSKLDSGLNKANKSIDDFGKRGKTAAKNTETLQKSLDKTGKESEETTTHVKKLDKSLEDETKQAKQSTDANEDNADAIEDVGLKSKAADKLVGGLKTTLGALGIGVGLAALISAFKEFAEHIVTASNGLSDIKNELSTTMGATVSTKTQQKIIDEELQSNRGLGVFGDQYSEILTNIVVDTTRNFADASEATQKAFVDKMIALANFGAENGVTDARKLGNDLYTLSKKWGMSADETLKFSDYMLRTSQDTGIGIDELTTNLLSFNDTAKRLSLDIYESTNLMASAFHNRNLDDLMGGWSNTGFTSLYDRFAEKMKTEYEAALEAGTTGWKSDETLTNDISKSFNDILKTAMTKASQGVNEDELTSWTATQLGVSDKVVRNAVKALIESVANDTTSWSMRGTDVTAESQLVITGYNSEVMKAYNETVKPDVQFASEEMAKTNELVAEIKSYVAETGKGVGDNMLERILTSQTWFNNTGVGDFLIRSMLTGTNKVTGVSNEERVQLELDTIKLEDAIANGMSRPAVADLFVKTLNDSKNLTAEGREIPDMTVDSLISINGQTTTISDYVKNLDDLTKLLPSQEDVAGLGAIGDILINLDKTIDGLDSNNINGFVSAIESAQKSLEELEKTDGIDTEETVVALEDIKNAIVSGDEGVIPALQGFDTSMGNSQVMIDKTMIPANSRLCESLRAVEQMYYRIAAAKAAAGM